MTIESVSARMERMEQTNRRWKAVGLGVLVLAGALAMVGQANAPAKVVRAERIELVDRAGVVRGLLATGPDGSPEITFSDALGVTQVSLRRLTDHAPRLTFADRNGKGRLCLALDVDGAPTLWMFDKAGKTRVVLSLTGKDEAGGMLILDKDGVVVGKLPQ